MSNEHLNAIDTSVLQQEQLEANFTAKAAADIEVERCLALNQEKLETFIIMITNVITSEISRKSAFCAMEKVRER